MPVTVRALATVVLALRIAAQPPAFFKTTLTVDEMAGKQAVVETTAGTFVMALLPQAAPNHVGYFIKLAQDGAYAGTVFHRMVKGGIVQGGDPLSKDPAKRDLYGRGGLGALEREFNDTRHVKGVVSMAHGDDPASASTSFFICTGTSTALDGAYTAFGKVVAGIDVVEAIERVERKGEEPVARVELRRVRVERK